MTKPVELKYETFSHSKFPKSGKCKKSCFANGHHRVGIVPIMSVLDGGLAGCSAVEICLECGKWFDKRRWFIPFNQPRELGVK